MKLTLPVTVIVVLSALAHGQNSGVPTPPAPLAPPPSPGSFSVLKQNASTGVLLGWEFYIAGQALLVNLTCNATATNAEEHNHTFSMEWLNETDTRSVYISDLIPFRLYTCLFEQRIWNKTEVLASHALSFRTREVVVRHFAPCDTWSIECTRNIYDSAGNRWDFGNGSILALDRNVRRTSGPGPLGTDVVIRVFSALRHNTLQFRCGTDNDTDYEVVIREQVPQLRPSCHLTPYSRCTESGCVCLVGFKDVQGVCININECAIDPNLCGAAQKCVDTLGSYTCPCIPGYSTNADKSCTNVNECKLPLPPCGVGTNITCTDTPGSYICRCRPGFLGCGSLCRDEDECFTQRPCERDETCVNNVGSYVCHCPSGMTGTGGTGGNCRDIDECRTGDYTCPNAHCVNQLRSYKCECNVGFLIHDDGCVDENECASSARLCGVERICNNTVGSYVCHCAAGYGPPLDAGADKTRCVDIDECLSNSTNGCNTDFGICENTVGAYLCSCQDGMQGDGVVCLRPQRLIESVTTASNSLFYLVGMACLALIIAMLALGLFVTRRNEKRRTSRAKRLAEGDGNVYGQGSRRSKREGDNGEIVYDSTCVEKQGTGYSVFNGFHKDENLYDAANTDGHSIQTENLQDFERTVADYGPSTSAETLADDGTPRSKRVARKPGVSPLTAGQTVSFGDGDSHASAIADGASGMAGGGVTTFGLATESNVHQGTLRSAGRKAGATKAAARGTQSNGTMYPVDMTSDGLMVFAVSNNTVVPLSVFGVQLQEAKIAMYSVTDGANGTLMLRDASTDGGTVAATVSKLTAMAAVIEVDSVVEYDVVKDLYGEYAFSADDGVVVPLAVFGITVTDTTAAKYKVIEAGDGVVDLYMDGMEEAIASVSLAEISTFMADHRRAPPAEDMYARCIMRDAKTGEFVFVSDTQKVAVPVSVFGIQLDEQNESLYDVTVAANGMVALFDIKQSEVIAVADAQDVAKHSAQAARAISAGGSVQRAIPTAQTEEMDLGSIYEPINAQDPAFKTMAASVKFVEKGRANRKRATLRRKHA